VIGAAAAAYAHLQRTLFTPDRCSGGLCAEI